MIVQMQIEDFSFDEDTSDNSIYLDDVFTDPDLAFGDSLEYSYSGNENIQIEIVGGYVTLTPDPDWFGSENISFIATDLYFESAQDDVIITVSPQPDSIVVTEILPTVGDVIINETETINFSFAGYDPDGNDLEYSWQIDDVEVSINSAYDFVTNYTSAGNYLVTLNVTDNFGIRNELN